ncbi:CAP domain-containing protein [Sphingomicrobium nitratireducens]|uniref:CAP domain-containing protein n=1 Tax=Sphingomicrobium nitratireducens TaxID=2964666 RepID=UPI0022404FEF|nr:CAP domain-containing protein [Sphingomicrobium nitratireducens]
MGLGLMALAIPAAASNMAHRGEDHLRLQTIAEHNRARAMHGLGPLQWDETLADEAYGHASYMARTGQFGHDRTPGRRKKQGENIWRGQRGYFTYHEMVGSFTDEVRLFRSGVFPNNSRSGDWYDVGHYTQIIWPTTTHVGCALASSRDKDYFVCRYSPPGNKDGVRLD